MMSWEGKVSTKACDWNTLRRKIIKLISTAVILRA